MTTIETIHTGKLCHDAMESRGQFPEAHRGSESITRGGIKIQARIKRPVMHQEQRVVIGPKTLYNAAY